MLHNILGSPFYGGQTVKDTYLRLRLNYPVSETEDDCADEVFLIPDIQIGQPKSPEDISELYVDS